jgi:hypothetical protein
MKGMTYKTVVIKSYLHLLWDGVIDSTVCISLRTPQDDLIKKLVSLEKCCLAYSLGVINFFSLTVNNKSNLAST